MTPIVLSKGVHRKCNKQEIAYLEKNIREMVDEMEIKTPPIFCPYPATAAELQKYKDHQIHHIG